MSNTLMVAARTLFVKSRASVHHAMKVLIGVKPDVEVKIAREDYLFNRDRILEAAEDFLKEKTAAIAKIKQTGKIE